MSLYSICEEAGRVTPGYQLGGEHDKAIWNVRLSRKSDCSSSTSRVLYLAGFFDAGWPLVSGGFANWGAPGEGKTFTVWYSDRHVWIEFHGKHKGWRFDTSPWGFEVGKRGPRLRRLPRSKRGFKPRHWPGH